PHSFYQQVKGASHAFQGITDATMLRGEEWQFVQLGKWLERADNTSRILDIKYQSMQSNGAILSEQIDAAQWMALLKSCSAFEAYRRFYVGRIAPARVAEFLIFSEVFPRSIRFSVTHASGALREIGSGVSTPEAKRAERLLGQLSSYLDYGSIDEVESHGMHTYLDDLQERLNRVTEELYAAYLIFEPVFAQGLQGAAQQQEQQ
ncbi:MAG TPA: alpha-E domain-containing protein, partial [Chloroflexota bacterium]